MFMEQLIRPPIEAAALSTALTLIGQIPDFSAGPGMVSIDRVRRWLPALMRPTYKTKEEALAAGGEIFTHYKGGVYRLLAEIGGSYDDPEYDDVTYVLYERLWPTPWIGHTFRDRFYGTVLVEIPGCEADESSIYEVKRFQPHT